MHMDALSISTTWFYFQVNTSCKVHFSSIRLVIFYRYYLFCSLSDLISQSLRFVDTEKLSVWGMGILSFDKLFHSISIVNDDIDKLTPGETEDQRHFYDKFCLNYSSWYLGSDSQPFVVFLTNIKSFSALQIGLIIDQLMV